MLARVRQRLLHDPQRVAPDPVRDGSQVGDVDIGIELHPGRPRLVEEDGQRCERRLRRRRFLAVARVAQRADHRAKVFERLVRARANDGDRARDLLRRRVGAELERPRVQAQQRDPVREDVVHLAGDPLPLGVTNLLDAQLLLGLGAAEVLALRLPAASAEHPRRHQRARVTPAPRITSTARSVPCNPCWMLLARATPPPAIAMTKITQSMSQSRRDRCAGGASSSSEAKSRRKRFIVAQRRPRPPPCPPDRSRCSHRLRSPQKSPCGRLSKPGWRANVGATGTHGAPSSKGTQAMPALARWTLRHKRLITGFWVVVTIAAFAAIGPAGKSLSQQFSVPGREGFEANQQIAKIYGSGGDVAPLVPVVQLPKGTTVDSPGVRSELAAALAHVSKALPRARIASYASTGDRSFVSADGRTTFALVNIPARGGVDQGQPEARLAQKALAGVTVGGANVRVTALDALRATATTRRGREPACCSER